MCHHKTELSKVINNKEYAITERNDKTDFDNPGEGQL